jgi:hypothetical protein
MEKRCEQCSKWSELVAESIGGGPVKALCEEPRSPYGMKMTHGKQGCEFWAEARDDQP